MFMYPIELCFNYLHYLPKRQIYISFPNTKSYPNRSVSQYLSSQRHYLNGSLFHPPLLPCTNPHTRDDWNSIPNQKVIVAHTTSSSTFHRYSSRSCSTRSLITQLPTHSIPSNQTHILRIQLCFTPYLWRHKNHHTTPWEIHQWRYPP